VRRSNIATAPPPPGRWPPEDDATHLRHPPGIRRLACDEDAEEEVQRTPSGDSAHLRAVDLGATDEGRTRRRRSLRPSNGTKERSTTTSAPATCEAGGKGGKGFVAGVLTATVVSRHVFLQLRLAGTRKPAGANAQSGGGGRRWGINRAARGALGGLGLHERSPGAAVSRQAAGPVASQQACRQGRREWRTSEPVQRREWRRTLRAGAWRVRPMRQRVRSRSHGAPPSRSPHQLSTVSRNRA